MKAVVLEKYQEPLRLAEVPEPRPARGEVAVRLAASGLNHLDERARTGSLKALQPVSLPKVMGSELSGTVTGLGDGVTGLAVGDAVIATASARDAEKVRGLGAEQVIDYRSQDFVAELAGAPVDVVLNTQGDDVTLRSMQVLRCGGTVIGIAGTPEPTVLERLGGSALLKPVLAWMSRRLRAEARKRGVTYRFLFITPDGEGLREVSALAATGAVRPVVDRVLLLEQAVEALDQLLSGGAKGKVLVTTDPAAATTRA